MRRAGAVGAADASLASAFPLRLSRKRGGTSEVAPYFVDWVRRALDERFGKDLYEKPLKVFTTLDLDLQGPRARRNPRLKEAILRDVCGGDPEYFKALSPLTLAEADQRILGSNYGSIRPAVDIPWLVDRYMAGDLKLDEMVSARLPLEEAPSALARLDRGEALRQILIP